MRAAGGEEVVGVRVPADGALDAPRHAAVGRGPSHGLRRGGGELRAAAGVPKEDLDVNIAKARKSAPAKELTVKRPVNFVYSEYLAERELDSLWLFLFPSLFPELVKPPTLSLWPCYFLFVFPELVKPPFRIFAVPS